MELGLSRRTPWHLLAGNRLYGKGFSNCDAVDYLAVMDGYRKVADGAIIALGRAGPAACAAPGRTPDRPVTIAPSPIMATVPAAA